MTRVKICGITRLEDALHAVCCGTDALGFIFYPGSPRYIDPDSARRIIAELPPFVTTVGLFVNEFPSRIRDVCSYCGLNVVQLHGDEDPGDCRIAPYRVVKAMRLDQKFDDEQLSRYLVSAFLLDASIPGMYGGTGQVCDWDLAARIAATRRVILAGGLTSENVAMAVRVVRPYGVDVSSGVEDQPGVKNPEKVAQFIRCAKELN